MNSTQPHDPQLAQLRWRCRRGMRELDMLLLKYVDKVYPTSDAETQAAFRRLLTTPDPEILALLTGRSSTDDAGVAGIIADLLENGPE
ncbi:MAG: succinate dehydrogenase assembly factor 2 [Gammaproteobacteria bacterium]|nr:succinate dehydrogenase assembly factor 2 [Gammaproteobacteria bacterium]NND54768.1 succinate dehydrogenase assembly factor 2 [Gammaproteobacteria bacterium]